jgi:hypothetical protein
MRASLWLCWARTARGHSNAALPRSTMKSRRLICVPETTCHNGSGTVARSGMYSNAKCSLWVTSGSKGLRFTPEIGHLQCTHLCLLWAKSGHCQSYSITMSARASNIGGIVSPIALAVLRLIANSNLLGLCTGRSAGFSPRKILSTYSAPRCHRSMRSGE